MVFTVPTLRCVLLVALAAAVHPAPVPLIIDTDIGGGGCHDVDGKVPSRSSRLSLVFAFPAL